MIPPHETASQMDHFGRVGAFPQLLRTTGLGHSIDHPSGSKRRRTAGTCRHSGRSALTHFLTHPPATVGLNVKDAPRRACGQQFGKLVAPLCDHDATRV